MSQTKKDQQAMLNKLGIKKLNEMQEDALLALESTSELVILSPTGSGKTLAFLLPIFERLNPKEQGVQALIIVPSRELAIQIEQVVRDIGSGYKANAVYGGRSGSKDRMDIKHPPAILIGTPGRVSDHIRKESIDTDRIRFLVLDEFDKSLEMGFEEEMSEIMYALPAIEMKILTSATQKVKIPDFVRLRNAKRLNYVKEGLKGLSIKIISSSEDQKRNDLSSLIKHLGNKNGIVFCNFKASIAEVSETLEEEGIAHASFYGGLEQLEREQALIKFRNGSVKVLLASDLAARGIDVPEMDYIIHYELPPRPDEFIHRNGRTARMNAEGTAYILWDHQEEIPSFIKGEKIRLPLLQNKINDTWKTLYVSGGRRDKISKGDIAGLFFKEGNLNKDELGIIELKQECAYVAVNSKRAKELIAKLNNSRLKKKKVRISLVN